MSSKILDAQIEQELRDKIAKLKAGLMELERYGFHQDARVKDLAIRALKAAGEWTN